MILVDLNQVVLSNLMQQLNIIKTDKVEESFLRHMVLNSIRSYKNKFGAEYGEIILCNDTSNYWRKDYFPHYKANRKKAQENSLFDWNLIFQSLNKIKDEIRENFPYKFVAVPRCEADDVIAVLTRTYHSTQKILIVSGDRDFVQLFKYPNVYQYAPVQKKFITEEYPDQFLEEKVIYGDAGDGVPNIASDDDTFVSGKRQRRVTSKIIETAETHPNYKRNKILIDFDSIPDWVFAQILEEYRKPMKGSKDKVYPYLINNKLKLLLTAHGEF